jgi:putative ABC transport system permease protein
MVASALVVSGSSRGGANIVLPGWMVVAMLGITLAMCVTAAIVSVRKVTRLDPAMVFKG